MRNVHEKGVPEDWRNMDCIQLWQLIQRMQSVRIGDIKMARAIDGLNQDGLPEVIFTSLHQSAFLVPLQSQAA